MRTLEEIENDIEQTLEHLHTLYNEKQKSLTRDININKNKYYVFTNPDDNDIKYIGKVYNYFVSNGEYIFNVTGIQYCFSKYRDSCWSGFDGLYQITVRPEKLDNFLDNFTEITKEEFDNKVNDWCRNVKKWISYWLDDE